MGGVVRADHHHHGVELIAHPRQLFREHAGRPSARNAEPDDVDGPFQAIGRPLRNEERQRLALGVRADAGHRRVAENRKPQRVLVAARTVPRDHVGIDAVAGVVGQVRPPRQQVDLGGNERDRATDREAQTQREATRHAPGRFHSLPSA